MFSKYSGKISTGMKKLFPSFVNSSAAKDGNLLNALHFHKRCRRHLFSPESETIGTIHWSCNGSLQKNFHISVKQKNSSRMFSSPSVTTAYRMNSPLSFPQSYDLERSLWKEGMHCGIW